MEIKSTGNVKMAHEGIHCFFTQYQIDAIKKIGQEKLNFIKRRRQVVSDYTQTYYSKKYITGCIDTFEAIIIFMEGKKIESKEVYQEKIG